jgi:hypothetical protein
VNPIVGSGAIEHRREQVGLLKRSGDHLSVRRHRPGDETPVAWEREALYSRASRTTTIRRGQRDNDVDGVAGTCSA